MINKYGKIYTNNYYFISKVFLIFSFKLSLLYLIYYFKVKSLLKVGIVGVRHEVNIGNNLIKYAMSVIISESGYKPYIIGTVWDKYNNIDFINKRTNLVIIKDNFSEIKTDEYDILIVNSDQTWTKYDQNFYDYGFLKFAENWTIPRFIYGASIGSDNWSFSKKDEEIAKKLLPKFSGISMREKDSIKLIQKNLGIHPEFVLDPTFLIDKKYYLDLIDNFKEKINKKRKYIFIYNLVKEQFTVKLMKQASKILHLETYYFPLNNNSLVENFLYYIINCDAVITNSYHGTVFSIIFNKPFISIYYRNRKTRVNSLRNLIDSEERFLRKGENPNYNLLIQPLNIKYEILNKEIENSINFIKKNLKK